MIVRNRKTGIEYTITKTDWAKLTEQKLHRNYLVLDPNDSTLQKIQVPKVIEEYQQNLGELKIVTPKGAKDEEIKQPKK